MIIYLCMYDLTWVPTSEWASHLLHSLCEMQADGQKVTMSMYDGRTDLKFNPLGKKLSFLIKFANVTVRDDYGK